MLKKFVFIICIGTTLSQIYASSHCDEGLKKGPNHFQAAPVLIEAHVKDGKTYVSGTLKSVKKTRFIIEFFNNPTNANPITEGAVFLGQLKVKTKSDGRAKFCAQLPCTAQGSFVSATATLLCQNEPTDTSPFSLNVVVQ